MRIAALKLNHSYSTYFQKANHAYLCQAQQLYCYGDTVTYGYIYFPLLAIN